MASIIRYASGSYAVQITVGDRRLTFGVGKVLKRDAEMIGRHIEKLKLLPTGCALPNDTTQWLASIRGSRLDKQLVKRGLLHRDEADSVTLGQWLDDYLTRRTDVKPATQITYRNIRRNLLACFDADKTLNTFTPADGDAFRTHLVSVEGLSDNTVRRRTGIARQVFNSAIRAKLVSENPFSHLPTSVRGRREKFQFVSIAEYQKLLDAAPDDEWRCIIALARIGGLRIPSEIEELRWSDIDWEQGRIAVTSVKTEHHAKGQRVIPLFPELATELKRHLTQAENKSPFVVGRERVGQKNLRAPFSKIIRRAGLKPWPKLFNNLRATRATELAKLHPQHVCSAWLGHSAAVAAEHYLRVTDDDFNLAVATPTGSLSAQKSAAKSLSSSGAEAENERKSRNDAQDESVFTVEKALSILEGVVKEKGLWAILDSNQ